MYEYAIKALRIQIERLRVQQWDSEMKYSDPEYAQYAIDNRKEISELQSAITVLESEGKE